MTTDRETAEVIRAWMKEETELDGAGIHRVLARLSDTPQRRHRWLWPFDLRLFTSGATRSADVDRMQAVDDRSGSSLPLSERFSTATGRTRLMFSPVKAIIAGTLVFVLGGAFLITQPLAQQDGLAPGAEPPRLEGTRVTVAQDCPDHGGICTWSSSDARLSGTFSHEFVGDIISVAGDDGDFSWADIALEGPDGTWTGRLYLSVTEPPVGLAVLSGSGAYEGWQYVATEIGGDGMHDEWSGIIYEGELPPFGPPSDPASE